MIFIYLHPPVFSTHMGIVINKKRWWGWKSCLPGRNLEQPVDASHWVQLWQHCLLQWQQQREIQMPREDNSQDRSLQWRRLLHLILWPFHTVAPPKVKKTTVDQQTFQYPGLKVTRSTKGCTSQKNNKLQK